MMNGPMSHVIKQSVLYTCVLSQPFIFYADAYPALQNEQAAEMEQLTYIDHDKTVIAPAKKNLESASSNERNASKYVFSGERALQDFQDHHELTITEQADQKILNTTISNEDNRHKNFLENMSRSVEPHMKSTDIETLQRALDHFDYYQGDIDGLYGPLTHKAVERAEEAFDMKLLDPEASGEVYKDKQTGPSEANKVKEQKDHRTQTQPSLEKEKQNDQTNQEAKQIERTNDQHQRAIQAARDQIGTPYDWGGESPDGFDCSGFIQYIFQMEDKAVPRTVNAMWNFTAQVDSPSIGDLVFFETYKPGPSHMGIYIGDDQFIHAGESRGVEKSKLSDSYWDERYIGAGRVQ